jgi:hypothetical protein
MHKINMHINITRHASLDVPDRTRLFERRRDRKSSKVNGGYGWT